MDKVLSQKEIDDLVDVIEDRKEPHFYGENISEEEMAQLLSTLNKREVDREFYNKVVKELKNKVRCVDCQYLGTERKYENKSYRCNRLKDSFIPKDSIDKYFICKLFGKKNPKDTIKVINGEIL